MNDRHDTAWPSISTICGDMNTTNKTVVKYIAELADKGYLIKEKRFSNSTIYHAHIPRSVERTLMEDLHRRSVDSTPTVVETLHSNKQVNKQRNKQKDGAVEIPPEINPVSWAEFEQHRTEIKKDLTTLSRTKAMNILKPLTFEQQSACIDRTIQNRWTGLFTEQSNEKNQRANQPRESNFAATARKLGDKIRAGG